MIKLDRLKKQYKDFSLDCSLEVKSGYITGLIGANGAGKSTTFKAILGLIKPDSGSIRLFGKEIGDLSITEKGQIGAVLSDSGFSNYLQIRDLVPILQGLYKGFNATWFIEQVRHFRLPEDKQIKDFSTGMKAKLKILVALSGQPKCLILDEPTAGLDVLARDEILDLLRDFMEQDEERSILISSHISSDLETICDDLYFIEDGRVILHADTDILLDNYGIIKVEVDDYKELDQNYILRSVKTSYGYRCLTNEKAYYLENSPQLVVENASIDDVLELMIKGVRS
ncbi:ATP-binding cassette domain-containing protein [Streptococcus ovis]|uniref:ATP-binding cassette domain-containing protein n=1 Tax=Streptococcus ovis TaxID=82806 RepID=UPI00036395C3|nr:ABC transporter ATP-binding protein [Streptococcus ovis]